MPRSDAVAVILRINVQKLRCARSEHIHEALRQYAGIENHALSKKFPLGLNDKDKLQGLWS